MKRDELGDLVAFLAVCEDRSFTRAAARIGTSQSALSHAVRRLEERLGVRLLNRTTRSVTPTEAGERLADTLRPSFDDIEQQLAQLDKFRSRPAGSIRLTSSRHAAERIVMPAVHDLLKDYPDIHVEVSVDQRFTDIVQNRFDAGIRLGESVERDMIAVRIGPDLRMGVVCSPSYLRDREPPATPRDLAGHSCINLRMASGGLYAWEFEKGGSQMNVRVEGSLTCTDAAFVVSAAEAGLGLACLPDDIVENAVSRGRLVRLLEDWCPPFPGYHLYYPSRKQHTPAFELLLDRLHWRG